jgi:hypothetical protein
LKIKFGTVYLREVDVRSIESVNFVNMEVVECLFASNVHNRLIFYYKYLYSIQ